MAHCNMIWPHYDHPGLLIILVGPDGIAPSLSRQLLLHQFLIDPISLKTSNCDDIGSLEPIDNPSLSLFQEQ